MDVEIIEREVHKPRLTITPTRVTLKFRYQHPDEDRLIDFADNIVEKMVPVNQSFRGHFFLSGGSYMITMQPNCKKGGHTFWENEIEHV